MSRDGPRFLFDLVQRARKFSGLRVCVWNSKLIGCYSACGARVQKLKKKLPNLGTRARQTMEPVYALSGFGDLPFRPSPSVLVYV